MLTRDLARRLSALIGLACPHQPRLPVLASLAPLALTCPDGEEDGSALVHGIGLQLGQSALGFPSLSFIYKVHSFPSLCIARQFIFSVIFSCQQVMSPALSWTRRRLLVFVTASPLPLFQWIEPTSLFVYCSSSACLHWTESTPSSSATLYCSLTFALFIVSQPSTSATSTTATELNQRKYRQWAIEAKSLLHAQGLWKYVPGEMRVPWPPIVATCDASSTNTPTARDPRDTGYHFLPESTDTSYLNQL